MTIKCPKCQFENPETKQFCADCGTRLIPSKDIEVSVTKTLETAPAELTRGTIVAGRYEILEELGTGGMGTVFRVYDKKLEEEVALKLIRPEIGTNRKAIERFRNEIKIARKITHKHVCRMHDLGEAEGTSFITMEYIPGQDLRGLVKQTGQLSLATAVSIARQAAEGLGEAHKLGIIHRDLKPGNIMIDKDGQAKIMDFGIARSLLGKGLTGEGAVVGTPEYMSPEQVEGKPADARSDIYSLGVILFEMVVGSPPFEGETPFSIATKHKTEPPPVPKKIMPQIPESLNALILRCLEKDEAKRYQTADELVADISAIEQSLPAADRALTRAKTKIKTSREITVKLTPRKLMIPAVAVVIVLVFVFFGSRYLFKKKIAYPPTVENSFLIVSFDNNTGDRSQDKLRNVFPAIMRTKFEQTGVRYVATLERMMELLRQVGKPDAEFIDSDTGFELARRDGVKALVAGSYGQSGNVFVTTLRVLDVETKASLATASASGTGPESVLTTQIDDLCHQIFPKLSFSRTQMEKAKIPVVEYSTASLEAYKNYVLGLEAQKKPDLLEAKKYFEKAVEIDSAFAIAYIYLSESLFYLGDWNKAMENLEKANTLRARASEKDRMFIEYNVALRKERDFARGLPILEEFVRKYPKDASALYLLATYYRCYLGRYDESSALYMKVLELDSSFSSLKHDIGNNIYMASRVIRNFDKYREHITKTYAPNSNDYYGATAFISFETGNLDEAIQFFRQSIAPGPKTAFSYADSNILHYMCALKEDWAEALKQLDNFAAEASTPGLKFQASLLKAIPETCLGRPKRAEQDIQEAQRVLGDARSVPEEQFFQGLIDWIRFWVAYDQDNLAECRRFMPVWPERSGQMFFSRTFFKLSSVLARGSLELKEKRLDRIKQTFDEMESIVSTIGPLKMPFSSSTDAARARFLLANFRAEVWLAENSPGKAVEALAGLVPPEPPDFQNTQFLIIYLAPFLKDTLARAYEQAGDIDKAIAEYERLLRVDPKIGPRFPPYPKYRLRLAKLFERKGNRAKAAEEYRRFLELWKDADSGQPELEDARKRLGGLKSN